MFVFVRASSASPLLIFKFPAFIYRGLSPLVAPPGVFDLDSISSFAFGHCPRLSPPACCSFPHGQSLRGHFF